MVIGIFLALAGGSYSITGAKIYQDQIKKAIRAYHIQGMDFRLNLIDYKPFGSFLHFEDTAAFTKPNYRTDPQGIPQIKYGANYYYNPVTVAQYALSLYGKYLQNQASLAEFKFVVDKLLEMQAENGAFKFSFAWYYYLIGKSFKPGWVSAMAQGQGLSVLARAYALTKDIRYLKAGEKTISFLLTPVDNGGVLDTLADLNPDWQQYITFEQYPVDPASYTLNGFMFTLLGCYDWWQINPGAVNGSFKLALVAFTAGVKTLDRILKYYDIGGFVTYDLGYITHKAQPRLDPFYFATDIYLLHALYSITGDPILKRYELLWSSYVA
jgi:hypothetical protein